MDKPFYKKAIGWGMVVWLIGYILGIVLFAFVPPASLGWIIMPIGILVSLWVLLKKVNEGSFWSYAQVGMIWTFIAVVFDYLFLVLIFKPADGYYKLDVYVYYVLTFVLPLIVGGYKQMHQKRSA